jgi:lysophospholipase L1-like esterase
MSQVITNAFEQYWQSSLAAEQPVILDEFILADIPNLDITSPIDPDTGLPPESQIVHRQNVDQRGRINNNAVAYSIVMDTTIGDFSFNAMYLRNKQNGVIGMIVYKGRETKLKTDQTTGQTGNSLVKSMLMGYDQAAEATLTHVDAGTWQIDYAARLRGQDEDLRQLTSQLYGHHTFIGDGFKVVQLDGGHQVTQGVAIVGGLRIELKQPQVIYPGTKPIGVWVDVHRAGSLLSEHQNHFTIITSVADLTDHVDDHGYQHYVAKLATVQTDSTVIDGRQDGLSDISPLVSYTPDPHASVVQAMVDGLPVRICVVGDSITNGTSVDTPFPVRLGEILREWYNNPNIEVIKRGYSGHDTGQVLAEHISEIVADDADLYLIALGVNDARRDRGITVDMYEQRLRTMHHRLSFAAVSFCSLTDVVGLLSTNVTNPYGIDAYRSRMKHVAQTCGARYIDSYAIMQRYLFNRGDARGRLSRDRLHWNQEGYDLIAESIFMAGFAETPLEVEPNRFIDNTTAAYRGAGNKLRTLNCPYSVFVETVESSQSKLFIFNTSLKPAYLLAHFTIRLSNDGLPTGEVTVKNSVEPAGRTYTLDIASVSAVPDNYFSEAPTSVCDLAPGLNIISFTTAVGKTNRITGFTVKEYADSYPLAMREKAKIGDKIHAGLLEQTNAVANAKFYSELPYRRVGSNHSNGASNVDDYYLQRSICTLAPRTYGETRFRIRGCFGTYGMLMLGQQTKVTDDEHNWSANYAPLFVLDFWATVTYMKLVAFTGTNVTVTNVTNNRGDQCIDIITGESGSQFYVNGVLLLNIPIKLPEMDVYVSSSWNSQGEGVVIESVAEVGTAVAPNTAVPGEKWFSHMDGKMNMVDKSGLHKTVLYA